MAAARQGTSRRSPTTAFARTSRGDGGSPSCLVSPRRAGAPAAFAPGGTPPLRSRLPPPPAPALERAHPMTTPSAHPAPPSAGDQRGATPRRSLSLMALGALVGLALAGYALFTARG